MKLLRPDSQPRSSKHPPDCSSIGLKPSDFFVLAVAAAHWPLGLTARNYWQIVHPERVVAFIAVVVGIVSIVAISWMKVGGERRVVIFTLFVTTVMLMRSGPIMWEYGNAAGWAIVVAASFLSWFLARRLAGEPLLAIVTTTLVVALASGPLIVGLTSVANIGIDETVARSDLSGIELTRRPDIFFIVVDGYPGLIALQQEFHESKGRLVDGLESRGYTVPSSAWSPYWTTERALSSILDMSYPAPDSALNLATRRGLHKIISGDNQTVELLTENGYKTTMVEAGWVGSSCGDNYDECMAPPLLDDLTFAVLLETAFGPPVVRAFGHAFSVSTLNSMAQLKQLALAADAEQPRFVFGHLLAPHAPFLLSERCDVVSSRDRVAASVFSQDSSEHALQHFKAQISCVDRFIEDFVQLVDSEDVVIFVGDHGSDRWRHLLSGDESDSPAVVQRMNVFLAARVRAECDVGDALVTANLMRRILSCYTDHRIDDIEERMFLPGAEMTEDVVRHLLDRRATADGA